MTTVLASTLAGKGVLSTTGESLGTVENVTMDVGSGRLAQVLVAPATDGPTDAPRGAARWFETTDDGTLIVPAQCMRDVDDYLVVGQPE